MKIKLYLNKPNWHLIHSFFQNLKTKQRLCIYSQNIKRKYNAQYNENEILGLSGCPTICNVNCYRKSSVFDSSFSDSLHCPVIYFCASNLKICLL